ncbi:MAG: T9SS type A sorting domain-containing protein [Bacteroidota bacterium]
MQTLSCFSKSLTCLFLLFLFGQICIAQEPSCAIGSDADGDGLYGCADIDCENLADCANAIPCQGETRFFQILESRRFVEFNAQTQEYEEIYNNSFLANAMGYNVRDGFIYGIRAGSGSQNTHLVKIGIDGIYQDLGVVEGLPDLVVNNFYTGDCDLDGHLYVTRSGLSNLYKIDIENRIVVDVFDIPVDLATNLADISFLPEQGVNEYGGRFYGVNGTSIHVIRFDPESGVMEAMADLSGEIGCSAAFGATFSDNSGNVYFFCNGDGNLYKYSPACDQLEVVSETGIVLGANDGASCPLSVGKACTPSSVLSMSPAPEVSIFPNPSSGIFNISANRAIKSIEVLSVVGRQLGMFYRPFNGSPSIDLSDHGPGTYLIRIDLGEEVIIRKVVVHGRGRA